MSFDTRKNNHGVGTRGRGGRASYITNLYPPSTKNDSLPPDRDILEGLKSTAIQSVTKPSATRGVGSVEARDVKFVGSYNWVDAVKPTMIVPGKLSRSYRIS